MWNKKPEHLGPFLAEVELARPPAARTLDETARVDTATAAAAGLTAFFDALLPIVGVPPSTVKEFPGLVRIVPGPGADEATLHIDMAAGPCAATDKPSLDRIVTLSVRFDHDYRLLGSGYYCIDCDLPENDTVH